ncbi:MAG: twin-arginine translocation pathway signal protein [Pseudomonadota bacterium]
MTLSRRKAIALIGGGTVLAASASAAGFVATRTPRRALEPWRLAGGYADPRQRALSYALLAPNAHNRQPWVAELIGVDRIRLHRDPALNLPETDPFDRQLTISMGCFLELLRIAAAQDGYMAAITPFPEGGDLIVADIVFSEGAAPDPLADGIMDRRSCKEPFEDRALEAEVAEALMPYAEIVTDPAKVAQIKALSWQAWQIEAMTPRTMKESVDMMRFGKAEINANPDGIDLGGPFLEALMLAGQISPEAQMNPESQSFKTGVAIYDEMLHATRAYAVITSNGNTRIDQLDAGRRWLRLNLATTLSGLALHPISQCLQEYPEMVDVYARAQSLMAGEGETVQMLGRLGYGPQTAQTPRWPLEAKLKNA